MMYFKSGGGSLTDEEQQVTDLLQAMVRIPSVAAKEGQVADLIEAFLAPELSAGLIKRERISYAPGRDNLVLTIGDPNAQRWLGVTGTWMSWMQAIPTSGSFLRSQPRLKMVNCMAAGRRI